MQYFISNNGQQAGPFELHDLIANGLNPQSLVWCEGMANWLPATQVPEVAQLLGAQQPTYPQPYQQQQYQQQYQYQQPSQQPMYAETMDFGESIKTCFSKYADFTGRASRAEYWWFQLFACLVSSITCSIGALVLFIPNWAVCARRLHDTNRSGWWQLITLIPIVGWILILYWTVLAGDEGDNEYGPKPFK